MALVFRRFRVPGIWVVALCTFVPALKACRVGLDVPPGAQIECDMDSDCPSGFRCTQSTGLCTSLATDTAPSVTVGAIGRARAEVSASLVVNDAEGDTVSIVAEYTLGDPSDPSAVWLPATAAASSDPLIDISDLGSERPTVFVWDALADAAAAPPDGLTAPSVVSIVGGAEQPAASEVGYAVCRLRFTPSGSGSGSGTPALSPAFEVGNDPPQAVISSIPTAPAGALTLEITLTDTAADTANFEVEFRQNPGDVWRRARLVLGSRTSLLTGVGTGTPHIFVWDSDAPLDPDPTVEQGIGGQRIDTVELRAWASDAPFGDVRFRGDDDIRPVGADIVNQTPPRVVNIRTPSTQTHGGVGVVPVHYNLIDDEGDRADIRVEVSFDYGQSWVLAREFLRPESEGTFALTTAPANPDGSGGVSHTFLWDPVGATTVSRDNTRVRIFASDGNNPETPVTEHQLARGISPTGQGYVQTNLSHTHQGALGYTIDINGDDVDDVVLMGRQVTALIADTSGGVPMGTYTFQQSTLFTDSTLSIRFIDFGDLNDDGKPDVVVGGGQPNMYAYVNTTSGVSLSFGGPGPIPFPDLGFPYYGPVPRWGRLGYFNGSADDLDLLVTTASSCQPGAPMGCATQYRTYVLTGDGSGNLGAPVLMPYTVFPNLDLDIDGDGLTDLVEVDSVANVVTVLLNTGSDFMEYQVLDGVDGKFRLVDLNSDGYLDMVGATGSSAELVFLWGQDVQGGGPAFVEGERRPVGLYPLRPTFADLNGDGLLDIAVGTGSVSGGTEFSATAFEVSILFGNGAEGQNDGTFGALTLLRNLPLPLFTVETMDTDGDGRREMYSYDNNATGGAKAMTRITLDDHSNPGLGHFSEGTQVGAFASSTRMLAGDITRDGISDIVSQYSDEIRIALGRGRQGFGEDAFDIYSIPMVDSVRSVRMGDVNGDDVLDLVVLVSDEASMESYGVALGVASNGAGTGEFGSFSFTPFPRNVQALDLLDMNRDGVLDLVAMDNHVAVYRGDVSGGRGTGTFSLTSTYETGGAILDSLTNSGDIDADGIPDFVSGSVYNFTLVRSNAMGAPSTHSVIDPSGTSFEFYNRYHRVLDVSDDGLPDLLMAVTSSTGTENLGYLAGSGLGGVASSGLVWAAGIGLTRAVSFVDVDADGDPEAVLSGRGEEKLSVSTLNRIGSAFFFTSIPEVPSNSGGEGMETVDLDGDRLPDFLLAALGPTQATVVHSQLSRHAGSNSRTLQPWMGSSAGEGAHTFGANVIQSGTDRFGQPWQADRITQSFASTSARGEFADFLAELRTEFLITGALRHLILPTRVDGDVYFARAGDDGTRLEVRERFGPVADGSLGAPNGTGLTLDGAPATQRGIVLVLPVSQRRQDTGYDSGQIRVFRKSFSWVRADEVETGSDATVTTLPRSVDRRGIAHDVFVEKATWVEVSLGDIDSGSGARFEYIDDAYGPRIEVVTDALGIFVAVVP